MRLIVLIFLINNAFQVSAGGNCRISISFGSVSKGIDRSKADSLRMFIKNNQKILIVDSLHWGREGEVDFCINFNKQSKKSQKQYCERIKKILHNKSNIYIEENKGLLHHR